MAVSWKSLGDRVRRQTDMSGGHNTGFLTDLKMIDALNAAGGELWDLLADNFTDWIVKDPAPTINVVSGTDSYSVADSDLLRVLGLDIKIDDDYRPLMKINFIERNDFVPSMVNVQATRGRPTHYFLYGEKIFLRPVPDTSITAGLRVWYAPTFSRITATQLADGSAGNIPAVFEKNVWDQLVVDGACARAKMMKEDVEDATIFDAWKKDAKQRIIEAKQHRDAGQPKSVTMLRRPGRYRRM